MPARRAMIGFALGVAAAGAMVAARADQPIHLGVRTGLWEITTQAQVSGAIPPRLSAQLQGMPPEQRARIEAAMQAAMADAQRGHVFKKCMTPEQLSKGFDSGGDSSRCRSTLVSNTRSDFEYHKVCAVENGVGRTEQAHFHLLDSHHIAGTVAVVSTRGGHPMTVHETLHGKWLASSCGSVKDIETVK